MPRDGVLLEPLRAPRPLAQSDIPVIVITHNEIRLIEAFFEHYRGLGVTRFLCVDDRSADGTREYIEAQPDADIFGSNVRFSAAHRGRLWRYMLVEHYGRNRWYLSLDADEFLLYPDWETLPLPVLTARLEKAGVFHMPAPMLDMYPPGRVSEARYEYKPGHMPWHVATLFDSGGYVLGGDERTWTLKGGVRRRLFASSAHLMKYPLVRWARITNFKRSMHFLNPYWHNYTPPLGVLLHFKFFDSYASDFEAAVQNAQHFNGALFYQNILDQIDDPDALVLESDISAEFNGVDDLLRRGFLQTI